MSVENSRELAIALEGGTQDERLVSIGKAMVDAFQEKTNPKESVVQEVIELVTGIDKESRWRIVQKLTTHLRDGQLTDQNLLWGLIEAFNRFERVNYKVVLNPGLSPIERKQQNPINSFNFDDLIKIIDVLFDRLRKVHRQEEH